jgi:hypothetical protein
VFVLASNTHCEKCDCFAPPCELSLLFGLELNSGLAGIVPYDNRSSPSTKPINAIIGESLYYHFEIPTSERGNSRHGLLWRSTHLVKQLKNDVTTRVAAEETRTFEDCRLFARPVLANDHFHYLAGDLKSTRARIPPIRKNAELAHHKKRGRQVGPIPRFGESRNSSMLNSWAAPPVLRRSVTAQLAVLAFAATLARP